MPIRNWQLCGRSLALLSSVSLLALSLYMHRQQGSEAPALAMLAEATPPVTDRNGAIAPVPDPASITYQAYTFEHYTVHVAQIPVSQGWAIVPAVSESLQTLPQFVQNGAELTMPPAAAINAGFFDPQNQLTTSYIVVDGEPVADPQDNERLMQNPDLTVHLPQILNRSEFRRYRCTTGDRYAIAQHLDLTPPDCVLLDAVGAGPRILPDLALATEAFLTVDEQGSVRDALGSSGRNARSAIALLPNGDVLLAMAAQQSEAPTHSGISLEEMAKFLASLGATDALNLDGGSSAGLWIEGQAIYGRVNGAGDRIERPIKSVLLVIPAELQH